jgi:hypothetical protein
VFVKVYCSEPFFKSLLVFENIVVYLMFVPCIIRRSRNNQHNAQICTTLPEDGNVVPKRVGATIHN